MLVAALHTAHQHLFRFFATTNDTVSDDPLIVNVWECSNSLFAPFPEIVPGDPLHKYCAALAVIETSTDSPDMDLSQTIPPVC